ncbi:MAG: serine proteinase inhibitor, partial [Bacteroidales bacterium]|nr:serine proteinase inhibitor [Bacteroidales bacterium]
KAKITVNEDGSKAAAVTDVYMAASTGIGGHARPAPEIIFHADRPFIYAITEVSTGAILFIGQYTGKE